MPFLIGIDEAGYAPNLGPLVVGASLWRVSACDLDLYSELNGIVDRKISSGNIAIADSKLIHQSKDLSRLESNLHAIHPSWAPASPPTLLNLLNDCLEVDYRELVDSNPQANFLSDSELGTLQQSIADEFSLQLNQITLPVTKLPSGNLKLRERFIEAQISRQIQLLKLVCWPVFPPAYNRLCEQLGNKSNVLSAVSLSLARQLIPETSAEEVVICCDKHGGRQRYTSVLERYLKTCSVHTELETPGQSRYRMCFPGRIVHARFSANGESELAVALASMYAKYVRELCMLAFNQFWQSRLESLSATKGYPVDARRFRREIEPLTESLGLSPNDYWRSR